MRNRRPLRLAAISAAASGVILGTLFFATVLFVSQTDLAERREELVTSLDAFLLDPAEAFDAEEFREAHPTYTVAVFRGASPENSGPLHLRPVDGFVESGAVLLYGRRFQGSTIVVASDLSELRRNLRTLAVSLGALWLPLTLFVGGATYAGALAMFRPLSRLTAQAQAAAGTPLGERLRTEDRAEFGEFAEALNGMLERIESEVRRGDRFAADASHELRTPLATLRTRIDTALLRPRTPDEYIEILGRARGEIDRLTDITRALLRSARGENGNVAPMELRPIVAELIEIWRERFVGKGVRLEVRLQDARAAIAAQEIRIVLDNLLDNALRFAPESSEVLVTLQQAAGGIELIVRDEGSGIPSDLGDRVFDRLVR
ncbi:HAMP domain-containing protein, partial [bacterium]